MKRLTKIFGCCLSLGMAFQCQQSAAQDSTVKTSQAASEADIYHPVDPPSDAKPIDGELETLFDAMEASAAASAKVFKPLSAEQLNFRPSDGSHTPRWNAEHMAGRQWQFFSQIFNAINPSIPVVDINPKQMPDDYEFGHADWSGAQEAERITQVSEYCRRYAYLLSDIGLDEKPPASRFPTLRALLVTMQKHYDQHTANVVKKVGSAGWPE